jgi:hypothetical protein
VNPKRKQTWSQSALVAIVGLAALIVSGDHAGARSGRSVDSVDPRTAGEPIMAIVSLHSRRITVYDASGWILRAPASSGQKGTRDARRDLRRHPKRSGALLEPV